MKAGNENKILAHYSKVQRLNKGKYECAISQTFL